MALTIRQLLAPSKLMDAIRPQMANFRAAYEGGPAFKNAVLIKRPSEDAALFKDKLSNVAAMPICKAVVDEIVDTVYEEEPTRHAAFLNAVNVNVGVPEWYDRFILDADMSGSTFTSVMEQAATMAGIEGWCWAFVDLPEVADPRNRPYVSLCPAENVIDWSMYNEFGKDFLEYLKVIEYSDADVTVIKVWYAGDMNTPTYCEKYIIPKGEQTAVDEEIAPADVFELPLGVPIPAVQVIARRDQRRADLGVSDLTEAADVQREMLKLEAEAYDSVRFSKPIIRAAAGVKVPAGGGGIVRGDKDCIEIFEIPTQDIAQIRAQQESLITRLDGFLGRGGLRKTSNSIQSGISIVEERRALHRKAAQRARQMESAEEMILDIVAIQMGLRWVGEVVYNKDFEDKDLQYRMALLKTAKELSPNNLFVQDIIDKEVIKLIAPPEVTEQYLASIGEATAPDPTRAEGYIADNASVIAEARQQNNIYGGEIRDAGVTTNDPIARQLIMMGVGR